MAESNQSKQTEGQKKPLNSKQKEYINKQMESLKSPKSLFSNVFFYIILGIILLIVFSSANGISKYGVEEIPLNEALIKIANDEVYNVNVSNDDIELQEQSGTKYVTKKETGITFDQILANSQISISKISGSLTIIESFKLEQILGAIFTFGLPILIIYIIFRAMKGASGDVFSFGKSRAKLFIKQDSSVTFKDVAGVQEAKEEMMEIVDFLKNPQKYQKLGARIPKGVLLVGPAGVGKTLLAKAVAGEAGVPFFSVAGSEFMEMLVGVGSSRVRDLFAMAREGQPSLIFIDEIDAIGRQRGMGIGGGHDEREQTLNQILTEMDGFDARTNVIVIAATNRPDMLDPALVRAGRFDRRISIPLPNLEERQEILAIHSRGKPLDKNIDMYKIAKKTVGFSGADIENMLNEAAILVASKNRKEITAKDLDEASLKVTIGPERRKRMTDTKDLELTAYHEAGHAVVGKFVKGLDPIDRITIIPRGQSLGHTNLSPEKDRLTETDIRLRSTIAMLMGGRVAEEVMFDEITTGASNDIEKATAIARKMVTEYGMSSLGPIHYDMSEESGWIAKSMGTSSHHSPDMAAKIDAEVEKIVSDGHKQATKIIKKQKALLVETAKMLLEVETIDEDEFNNLVKTHQTK